MTSEPNQTLALDVRELTKSFGARKAVDSLSLQLPEGAFLSVFGPNGAGKTTLVRMLSTLVRPTGGSAFVCGADVVEQPAQVRERIGVISHEPMLYPDLTALENLELFGSLYGVTDPSARAMELLEAVELKSRRLDPVRAYSRGMTQRLAIARALVNDPELLFLDEPYSGLDPHACQVLDQLLGQVGQGRTLCMVSHDLRKGYDMATHVLLMNRGRVELFAPVGECSFDELQDRYLSLAGGGSRER